MGQSKKELKILLAECRLYDLEHEALKKRTELILSAYRRKIYQKQIDFEVTNKDDQRRRILTYMMALRDFRLATDSLEMREAVGYLSAAGYLDSMVSHAMRNVLLKRPEGSVYFEILDRKYDGSGGYKDYVIAMNLKIGHTQMSNRKKEAILAVGIEMMKETIPEALREIATMKPSS